MNGISIINMIIGLLSGVALFLYGMSVMGDGLKRVAGNKLEALLYKLTNTPLKGILLGAGVTAVIQSSSATSVMVVGFVNSGMMKVAQGIGIIMGANIGTSITGWILCLSDVGGAEGIGTLISSATIASVFAVVGILLRNFSKRDTEKYVGEIMLGFAVLMMGMAAMKTAMKPLETNESFRNMLSNFSNPILGILIGIVATAILQSASASVGILQSIAVASFLPFSAALPITMGIGVGAACPVLLSGMNSNKNGKRTALVYLINDLFGMIIWAAIFYIAQAIITGGKTFDFMDMRMDSVKIALLNTVYRVLTIIVLAPFIKQIEKLVFFLIKDSAEELEDQADFDLLEERFLAYPDLAIAQSHTVMNGMAKKARKNVYRAFSLMENYSEDKFAKVQEKEALIDRYEDKLGNYLMQVTRTEMSVPQTHVTSKLLHTISDFERIGDHASGISKVAKELNEKGISFSEDAMAEIAVVEAADKELVDITVGAFINDDAEAARQVEPLRQIVRVLCGELKSRHIYRIQKGKCDMEHGFAFNDMLNNLDRIGAHCSNIAVALIENEASDVEMSEFDTHAYLKEIRAEKEGQFLKSFEVYEKKYSLPKEKDKKKKNK